MRPWRLELTLFCLITCSLSKISLAVRTVRNRVRLEALRVRYLLHRFEVSPKRVSISFSTGAILARCSVGPNRFNDPLASLIQGCELLQLFFHSSLDSTSSKAFELARHHRANFCVQALDPIFRQGGGEEGIVVPQVACTFLLLS